MKLLFSLFLLLWNCTAHGQVTTTIQWQQNKTAEAGDTIYYSASRKLKWNDFRAQPDNKSIAAAITTSGFGYALAMHSRNGITGISISVYCFFNKSKSWVKSGLGSDYALLHEQHHFDITYIGACLFIKKLRAANFTLSNYAALIGKIDNESNSEMERMQDEYDGNTRNGQLKNVQAGWNKKIEIQLAAIATNSR